MNIILNNTSMIPIYEQVMDQIKHLILGGKLTAGDVLPSVRALSAELRISALTVKKAYDRLEEDGYVSTVHGKGTYVAAANLQLALEARRAEIENALAGAIAKAKALGMTREEILETTALLLEE